MDSERRSLLTRNLLQFCESLKVQSTLDVLSKRGLFHADVVEKISSNIRLAEQRRAIIREVQNRGDEAFNVFYEALMQTHQTQLAIIMKPLYSGAGLNLQVWEDENLQVYNRSLNENINDDFPMEARGIIHDLTVELIDGGESQQAPPFDKQTTYANFSPDNQCLIINNEIFYGMPSRQGTEVDKKNLISLFKQLGYEVTVVENLSDKEMLSVARNFAADKRHSHASSTVVIVLTHGELNELIGVNDGRVSVHEFISCFNAQNAPLLSGKPKLVFIQACRGGSYDLGYATDETDSFGFLQCVRPTPRQPTRDQPADRLPIEADVIVSFATPPQFVSWRNSLKGSWFIQAICEVFAKHARALDILSLLTLVNERVSKCYQATNSQYKQIPSFESRLRKRFYFFPGLNAPFSSAV